MGRKSGAAGGGGASRRGGVALSDLVASGVIVPGRRNISLAYKGVTHTADLAADGAIEYQGGCLLWRLRGQVILV
jgi:hypothetical protein